MLRLLTLVLGSVEVIVFVLLAHALLQSSDPLEGDLGWGSAFRLSLPLFVLTLPGVLLAWLDRAPKTALVLVLLAVPALLLIWV